MTGTQDTLQTPTEASTRMRQLTPSPVRQHGMQHVCLTKALHARPPPPGGTPPLPPPACAGAPAPPAWRAVGRSQARPARRRSGPRWPAGLRRPPSRAPTCLAAAPATRRTHGAHPGPQPALLPGAAAQPPAWAVQHRSDAEEGALAQQQPVPLPVMPDTGMTHGTSSALLCVHFSKRPSRACVGAWQLCRAAPGVRAVRCGSRAARLRVVPAGRGE